MSHRLTPARVTPRLAPGALTACMLALPLPLAAGDPGWYAGFNGFYSGLEDSAGYTFIPGTPATPGTPPGNNCLLGNLLGLGSLIDLLGGTGPQGCLLGLLGPGSPGSDPIDPTAAQTLGTGIAYTDGFGASFALGYAFDGGFRPELALSYAENDWDTVTIVAANGARSTNRSENSLSALRLMGNAWFDLDFGGWALPYLGGGVGYQRSEVSGDMSESDSGFAWQLGAGVGFLLSERMTLSLDYRYLTAADPEYATADGGKLTTEYKAHNAGIGLRYLFAPAAPADGDGDGVPDRKDRCPNTPAGAQVDSRGCPLDSDGDGVADHLDQCPNTPRGVQVGLDGCPLDADGDGIPDGLDRCPSTPPGTPVGPDGCPLTDSDGDGVPDHLDQCPGTPPGIAVSADGCPADADGDGVADHLDECPDTPPGAKVLPSGCALEGDCRRPRPGEQVDRRGCAVEHSFILKGVKFEFDSDRLTPDAQRILNEVAETLKAYPQVKVDLEGHTDDIGTDAYNLGLSERRANAVKRYLAGRGTDGRRMNPVGYGESRPIESNESEAGRETNRRVELKVLD